MKKTLLKSFPYNVPQVIMRIISDADIYDSSCSPEAKVYFIDKDGGYYLKRSEKASLKKEAEMSAYFHSKGIGAEVLDYISGDCDWLLTAALNGNDCIYERYLQDPIRLCDTIAYELRKLHETDYSGCPVTDRTADYIASAMQNYKTGNYDSSYFPDNFGYHTAEEAYTELKNGINALQSKVLLHGDYCLPNIILDEWKLSGFIDVGCGGIGDRHIDLFWGVWTLRFNLKTNKYRNRFLDAYGRDKADEALLKIIAAAEIFC